MTRFPPSYSKLLEFLNSDKVLVILKRRLQVDSSRVAGSKLKAHTEFDGQELVELLQSLQLTRSSSTECASANTS